MDGLNRRGFLKGSLLAGTAMAGMAVMPEKTLTAAIPKAGAAEPAGPGPEYEIYACKYAGPLVKKLAMALWNSGWDEDSPINFYVWAIREPSGETILVDSGCSPAQAAARKIPGYVNPVELLARLGVNGSNVSKIVITHMHYDHVGNVENYIQAFPKAKLYLQKREFDFAVKNPLAQRKPISVLFDSPICKFVGGLEGSDRLAIVDGDGNLAPGIDFFLAPGHTLGLQVVRVNTAKGPAVVGSDCAHLFRGYRDDNPSCFITDMPAWMESFDKVKSKAPLDLIFPGHDVLMQTNYPSVAEDVMRLV